MRIRTLTAAAALACVAILGGATAASAATPMSAPVDLDDPAHSHYGQLGSNGSGQGASIVANDYHL
ncbi:hypothetical protein GPA10_28360 [Streptomyces sp. p1417]|uniref:Uncharacterized protein n=1 Tax=Streptomyces typhae TaxID=2681492 RepID=A0A6L6X437_9ACTN|nr:hypothetical protein [Streptomyces typhae]MVO88568.1 hypothetical protein [Streptomyces typhae]